MKTTKLPVTERVKTIEDAYKDGGHSMGEMRPFAEPVNPYQEYMNACADEFVLVEALNEGEDPKDNNYGYIPVFYSGGKDGSGFGLSGVDSDWAYSTSSVGSHRTFVNSSLARYAGENFTELYKKIHLKK